MNDKVKDPCLMTYEEAQVEYRRWELLAMKGIRTFKGKDVEGHLEMLRDRITIISTNE